MSLMSLISFYNGDKDELKAGESKLLPGPFHKMLPRVRPDFET